MDDEVRRDAAAYPEPVVIGFGIPEPEARAELRGWLWLWMYTAAMQGNGTLNPRADELPEAEAILFAIALRQLFLGVEWAIANTETNRDQSRAEALRAALDAFDDSVPHAKGVRNVLAHFDEYERGEGNLQKAQKKAGKRPSRLNVYTKDDGTTFWLYVLDDDDHRLDVRNALEAAQQLTASVLEVLSD